VISGTPDADASTGGDPLNPGTYVIPVTVTDPSGETFTTNVTYTLTNPAPVAENDNLDVAEGGMLTGSIVVGRDIDPDGDTLTVTEINGNPANVGQPVIGSNGGIFIVDSTGAMTFDTNGEYEGLDVGETAVTTLSYEISDGEGGIDTATVTVTVQGANDAPITTGTLSPQNGPDSVEQLPLDTSVIFSDIDGEPLAFTSPDLPSWMTLEPVTGVLTGTPPADASQGGPNSDGEYIVTITATDPDGEAVSTTVTYTFTNPVPTAQDNVVTAAEDGVAATGNVIADNDATVGLDNDPDGDTLVITDVNGTPVSSGAPGVAVGAYGTLTQNADGRYSYAADNANAVVQALADGETLNETFTYTISDGEGGTATADLVVTIEGTNDLITPQIPGDPNVPADRTNFIPDQSGVDSVLASDLDVASFFTDADVTDVITLTIDPTDLPTGLTFNGTTISGTPTADASQGGMNGVYDVPVTVTDSNGDTFVSTLTYTITNPAPVAENDTLTGTESDTAATFDVFPANGIAIDSDPDGDAISVTRVVAGNNVAALGTVLDGVNVGGPVAGSTGGLFTIFLDGTARFDANGEFEDLAVGETRITEVVYQIDDGQGGTDTAVVAYTVTGENDPVTLVVPGDPNAPADPLNYIPTQSGTDSATVTPLDLTLYFADSDASDVVTLTLDPTDLPAGLSFDGTFISGTPTADASQGGVSTALGGVYTIPVTATDSNGSTVVTNVTYTISNLAPDAVNDSYTTPEETPISVNVLTNNDSDPDGDALTVTAVRLSDGTVVPFGTLTTLPQGDLTVNSDGSIDFDPTLNFNGQLVLEYDISDGEGGTDTAAAIFDVTPVNDNPNPVVPGDPNAPVDPSNYIPVQTTEDSALSTPLDLTSFFADVDADPLTLTIDPADLPAGLTFDGTTISGTPETDASQGGMSGVYVIPVGVDDGHGGTFTTNLTYTVANPIPVVDTPVGTQMGVDAEPLTISTNITDPDGDVMTYSVTGLPVGLTIDPATGEISGTPENSASQNGSANDGVYAITVTADDGEGGVVTDSFDLTITNPAPVAADDPLVTTEGAVVATNVLTVNDSDPDGDTLVVSQVAGDAANIGVATDGTNGGSFTIDATGALNFDPDGDFEGLEIGETATTTITYEISDGEGGTDMATVTITVQGANDAPIVTGILSPQNGSDSAEQLPLDTSAIFSDVDGEPLAFTSPDLPSWMTLDHVTGILTATPPADASQAGPNGDGTYPVTIMATDLDGESVSTTVTYTFTNLAPVAGNDDLSTDEDTTISGNVIVANDVDVDGDTLVIASVNGAVASVGTPISGSGGGTFTINSDGSYDFDPAGDFNALAAGETATTTVSYVLSDGEGGTDTATIMVTITGTNDTPIGVDPTQPVGPSDPSDPSDPQDPRDPPVDPQD
jgi:VCBS repeat-containing protein